MVAKKKELGIGDGDEERTSIPHLLAWTDKPDKAAKPRLAALDPPEKPLSFPRQPDLQSLPSKPGPPEKPAASAKQSIFEKPPLSAKPQGLFGAKQPPAPRPVLQPALDRPLPADPAKLASVFRPILLDRPAAKEATPKRESPGKDPRRQATTDGGRRQFRISTDAKREVKIGSDEQYLQLIKEDPPAPRPAPRLQIDSRPAELPRPKLATPHKSQRPPSRMPPASNPPLPPAGMKRVPPPDPNKKINIVLAADVAMAKQRREREKEIQLVHQLPLSSSSSSHRSAAKDEERESPELPEPQVAAETETAEPRAPVPPPQQPMVLELEEVAHERRRPARPASKKPQPKEYVYEEREPRRIQQPLQLLAAAEERHERLAEKVQAIRASMSSVSAEKVDEMIGYLSQVIARDRIPEDEDIRQFEQRYRRYLASMSPAEVIHLYQLLHLQVQISR